ncbi:MAG: hypothetical protein V2B14_02710 [bacterium]
MDNIKRIIIEARNEILVNNNPAKAIISIIELPENIKNNALLKNTLALAYLENKNYIEAAKIYYELDEKYQAGFCELLLGNKDTARKLWFSAPNSSAICWGKCLIDFINLKVGQTPSFLQIRNHLECNIGYFIQANQLVYIENIIKCSEVLASINLETYKFIGRALMNHNFPNLAVAYLLKSQKIVPHDPEIYFHLAQYSYQTEAYQEGKNMILKCLSLNKNFLPAKKLLEKMEEKL